MENRENLIRQNGNLPQNREERIYKVKLENAQIVVVEIPPNAILLTERNGEWKAYLANGDKLEGVDSRIIPFLLRLAEISEELKEIEEMLLEE